MRPPVVEKETVFSRLVESKIFLSLLRSPQKYNAHFYSKPPRIPPHEHFIPCVGTHARV